MSKIRYVGLDVHAATIGEIRFGAGRTYKDFLAANGLPMPQGK